MSNNDPKSMLKMFIFETAHQLEQLEEITIKSEKLNAYSSADIAEIFRIMHCIKGSAAMMGYGGISGLAHVMEDLFDYIRGREDQKIDFIQLTDLVLKCTDYINLELAEIEKGSTATFNPNQLIEEIKGFLKYLQLDNDPIENLAGEEKVPVLEQVENANNLPARAASGGKATSGNMFRAKIYFEKDCEMENVRAFAIIHNLQDIAGEITYLPVDLDDNLNSERKIRDDGFTIYFKTNYSLEEMKEYFMRVIFLRHLELSILEEHPAAQNDGQEETIVSDPCSNLLEVNEMQAQNGMKGHLPHIAQSLISVDVTKLDRLMDLVGEMVIAEAMLIQNPDIKDLKLPNFSKAATQLNKITQELQSMVMSIRMLPLSTTFCKMQRLVRDMSKKLGKDVDLAFFGEQTEVDKNIIEHLSDPLMHLVRNAIDHGLGTVEERLQRGKPKQGIITIGAKDLGGDVLVTIKDDGRGLDREEILEKARQKGLIPQDHGYIPDKEVWNLTLLPGFSTKAEVSEYSGRGVGMDVVVQSIEAIGGSISINSRVGEGTEVTLKIPLTLSIIDGMNIKVGSARYTIPTHSIKESFRPKSENVIIDPEGNEMIIIRGLCYPIIRLHRLYRIETQSVEISQGILIMVEDGARAACLFADELLGQQQIVVKNLPDYIRRFNNIRGIAGCSLLGDGNITLILNVGDFINLYND